LQVRGCGGLYKLGCHGSLALVNKKGETSGACAGGACADGACVDGACTNRACVDGAVARGKIKAVAAGNNC
jgi:hypothetical protein